MAGFIARKRLHMGDGLHREYGEPVPEAEGWLNRDAAVRCGEIERVSDHDYAEACARWEARERAAAERAAAERAAAERAQAEALAALASLPSVVVEPVAEGAPQPIAFPADEVSIHVEPRAEPEPEPEQDASADLRSTPVLVADVLAGDAEGDEPEAPKHSGGKRAKRRG